MVFLLVHLDIMQVEVVEAEVTFHQQMVLVV
jgi:hypothetical protein